MICSLATSRRDLSLLFSSISFSRACNRKERSARCVASSLTAVRGLAQCCHARLLCNTVMQCGQVCAYMHTHTYTHECMHTCTWMHAYTHIHAHSIHACMHACTHAHTHTHTHIFMFTAYATLNVGVKKKLASSLIKELSIDQSPGTLPFILIKHSHGLKNCSHNLTKHSHGLTKCSYNLIKPSNSLTKCSYNPIKHSHKLLKHVESRYPAK